ncbi:hypothetical protein DV738_g2944, partial [Chaetothyriales sp. CBS 135597]
MSSPKLSAPPAPNLTIPATPPISEPRGSSVSNKRQVDETHDLPHPLNGASPHSAAQGSKRLKQNALEQAAPLAERVRPKTLDDVCGQELVGPQGVLRGLIESDRVPSMILWGGPGTGKTTIARVIASSVGSRFVEINSTSTGVAECKKIFGEARHELALTGRKTIIFCDEIHRFSKSQQDVFLGPVEAGVVTLIGATTENPSFKVGNALLSRCRTFTLAKLTDEDIFRILTRAMTIQIQQRPSALLDDNLLRYLASFADGDARTALNLLELSVSLLTHQPNLSFDQLKSSLTKTLVYDRSGDQHYDTISAFHKSVRGSDADAALYYLARMLASGEDSLYIARRMIVIASEDIGLADNSMLPLAIAAYTACEKVGMPEARINLAHVAVALCQAPKSTRAYRGLNSAMAAIQSEPGVGGLPIPIHLRNAPTRLMKELGYGKEYKYNPNYRDGKVKQEYLPDKLKGRTFLEQNDFGDQIDRDLLDFPNDIYIQSERAKALRIAIFEDLHFGEDEDSLWAPAQDRESLDVMTTILSTESPDLVVLNGDLITGDNTFAENSTAYLDMLVRPLVKNNIQFASVYGNHDNQVNISAAALYRREKELYHRHSLTRSDVAGTEVDVGVSNYFLPIFFPGRTPASRQPDLLLWFFDSKGGRRFSPGRPSDSKQIVGQVDPKVVSWFQATSSNLKHYYHAEIPSLAFVHIPVSIMGQFQKNYAPLDPTRFPGLNQDYPMDCQNDDEPFWKALVSDPSIKAVFSAHDHAKGL